MRIMSDAGKWNEVAVEEFGPLCLSDPDIKPYWIDVVIGIIGAVAGAIKDNNTAKWQSEISDKLDQIIQGQQKILDDLKQLRVDINAMFVANNLTTLMSDMAAKRHMLDTALASGKTFDKVSKDQIAKIQFIADQVEDNSYKLMQSGLGGYHFVAVGFSIAMIVYRLLRYNRDSFRKLCDDFTAYFRDAIDVEKSGSFSAKLAFANFAVQSYPPFLSRFEDACGGDKGGRVTREVPMPFQGSTCLVGWFRGDRHSSYEMRAFDGASGPRSLFPRFNPNNANDFWEEIDPKVVYARQRAYDCLGAASSIAADWQWADTHHETLKQTVEEISKALVAIEAARHDYPHF